MLAAAGGLLVAQEVAHRPADADHARDLGDRLAGVVHRAGRVELERVVLVLPADPPRTRAGGRG